jgi:hypothetical protein
MKAILTLILFISLYSGKAIAQPNEKQRKITMVKFLLNQKALASTPNITIDTWVGAIYERKIFNIKKHPKGSNIYFFGSNSAHSKSYLALEDFTGLKLLETKDLNVDMKLIISFMKRNNVSEQEVFKLLLEIADTYEDNSKMNFLPIEDTH